MWWADPGRVRPEHLALLDEQETARWARLRRDEDRNRLATGVTLTRLVVGRHLGLPPESVPVTRACPECAAPHGKPRVLGAVAGGPDWQLSVSHSGALVALAVCRGVTVGVDVEFVDPAVDVEVLAEGVLSPDEWAGLDRAPDPRIGLLRYWTRKEAVLKATGDGLRVPMRDLTVTAPTDPPALLRWRGRPGIEDRVAMTDLRPGPDHVASLAVLDAPAPLVRHRDGMTLLGPCVARPAEQARPT